MTPTPPPGASAPSTLMGTGWRARTADHVDELGITWAALGVGSETARLTDVLLTWPADSLAFDGEPGAWLMHARPDLGRMRDEATGLADAYAAEGVQVHWLHPVPAAGAPAPLPNLVFARDLLFMTPEGAVLARMAAQQRAGEERMAALALATLGVPILATPRGDATFEGADALWIRPDLVAVGTGRRTNAGGLALVQRVLAEQGVRCVSVPLSQQVQHLLGSLNLVRDDLAVVREPGPELLLLLRDNGIEAIALDTAEVAAGRANNFVTLRPGAVLMPGGCPRSRATLEARGVHVLERPITQYLCAAGGIGCATGILGRRA